MNNNLFHPKYTITVQKEYPHHFIINEHIRVFTGSLEDRSFHSVASQELMRFMTLEAAFIKMAQISDQFIVGYSYQEISYEDFILKVEVKLEGKNSQ